MASFLGSVLTDRSGKFSRRDDFAGLGAPGGGDDDGYDFDDTYDGLGDQLEEGNDDLNDETFGDVGAVGKDFDFGGKTEQASDTLQEEQLRFERSRPVERRVEIDRSIAQASPWGAVPAARNDIWSDGARRSPFAAPSSFNAPEPPKRRPQTLEEIEAAMLANASRPSAPTPSSAHYPPVDAQGPPGFARGPVYQQPYPQQHPQQYPPQPFRQPSPERVLQPIVQPVQPAQPAPPTRDIPPPLDEAATKAVVERNLRRAQKIGQMARHNGAMSNGDKNYVLKVQISQLVKEDPEADDFYFTVHSTLRGRSELQQGLGHFEQTYMARAGQQSNRRGGRDRQNPLVKMQQQVQKIVENAKNRPKSTGLALEGSLGRLSFSRVRQPRQMLDIGKLAEGAPVRSRQTKKEALSNIESAYGLLLQLEQTGRGMPSEQEALSAWQSQMDRLVDTLWDTLRVMDQVDASVEMHPFVQLLQYGKGKKLIPRLYRSLSEERRLTLITVIVAHLDMLDVVRAARHDDPDAVPRELRDEVELFTQTVLPPCLAYISSAPIAIVGGLLNMLLGRNRLELLLLSKVGLSFLTMFLSRAELAKQAQDGGDLSAWSGAYDAMFSRLEGRLYLVFPPSRPYSDDVYPWQFLAALALGASPEQQHTLVNEARDRVLDNVQGTRGLPREVVDLKRGNVNLFLNAIGLDASQLDN